MLLEGGTVYNYNIEEANGSNVPLKEGFVEKTETASKPLKTGVEFGQSFLNLAQLTPFVPIYPHLSSPIKY